MYICMLYIHIYICIYIYIYIYILIDLALFSKMFIYEAKQGYISL